MYKCKIKYLEEVANTLYYRIESCKNNFLNCKELYQQLFAIAYQIMTSMYKKIVYENILIINDKKMLHTMLNSSINSFSGVTFNKYFKFSDPNIIEKLKAILESINEKNLTNINYYKINKL